MQCPEQGRRPCVQRLIRLVEASYASNPKGPGKHRAVLCLLLQLRDTSCDETEDSATDDAELDRFSCAACSTMAASSSLKSSMISGDGMENCSTGSSVLRQC